MMNRLRIHPIVIALAFAWLSLFAMSAWGDVVGHAHHRNGDLMLLHDDACALPVPHAGESQRVEWLKPKIELRAIRYSGCWRLNETAPFVEVEWSDGDASTLPRRAFTPGPPRWEPST